jgi:hypothetical protein
MERSRHSQPARAGVEIMLAAPATAETVRSCAPRLVTSMLRGLGFDGDGDSIVTLNVPSARYATPL